MIQRKTYAVPHWCMLSYTENQQGHGKIYQEHIVKTDQHSTSGTELSTALLCGTFHVSEGSFQGSHTPTHRGIKVD